MKYNKFGNTELIVSEIGFGAWGIGGPAMAGNTPIGWGIVDDAESKKALIKSLDLGINFYDTADFYGLGHSEELIGEVFKGSKDIIIATKVGHRLDDDNSILLDYSYNHIISACNKSLQRLKRDYIDLYQLHSAKMEHLLQGECISAMQDLSKQGKIRYWGISLNTFNPEPEANYFIDKKIGSSFQLVYNLINQKSLSLIEKASQAGYGIIARMPLQFGTLTGKFSKDAKFDNNDHRAFRLNAQILSSILDDTDEVWNLTDKYNTSKTGLSLSFILSTKGVSTTIPGIKTVAQAISNTSNIVSIEKDDLIFLNSLYESKFNKIVEMMKKQG